MHTGGDAPARRSPIPHHLAALFAALVLTACDRVPGDPVEQCESLVRHSRDPLFEVRDDDVASGQVVELWPTHWSRLPKGHRTVPDAEFLVSLDQGNGFVAVGRGSGKSRGPLGPASTAKPDEADQRDLAPIGVPYKFDAPEVEEATPMRICVPIDIGDSYRKSTVELTVRPAPKP